MVGALGVNQAWLFTGTFFLGSMLAGLGGAAQLPKGGADLLMDFNILAAVFVVVVVGGMGSIAGAFLAAVLISELGAFGDPHHPPEHPRAHVRGDGGGPHLPAVGAARPPGGARPARAGRAAGAAPPGAPAPPPGGGSRAPRGAARAARVRGRLHLGARGRDRDHGPLRGEPALRDGAGGHGLVRARRLLRRRRLRGRPPRQVHGLPDGGRPPLRPRDGRGARPRLRLVLRALDRGLPRHADPRLRAGRLVDRVPVGRGHRGRRRHPRRLAERMGERSPRLLLPVGVRLRGRDPRPPVRPPLAVRVRDAGPAATR